MEDQEGTGSWFLVSWPERGLPQIEMEFWTREEAEAALEATLRVCVDIRGVDDRMTTAVCPGFALIDDPFLQRSLVEWDERVSELESIEHRVLRGS
jgi:hypothetical protein